MIDTFARNKLYAEQQLLKLENSFRLFDQRHYMFIQQSIPRNSFRHTNLSTAFGFSAGGPTIVAFAMPSGLMSHV